MTELTYLFPFLALEMQENIQTIIHNNIYLDEMV